ncbi:MAG: hypothetical protein QNJ98_07925 [Planctomycetota bacterium]|nr:hypothetical protein [Planctomycetota bacterium]
MRTILSTLGAFTLALLVAAPAYAEESDNDRGPRFGKAKHKHRIARILKRLDTNQDGALAQDEVPAKLWERIGAADTDGSASVTKDELKAFRKAKRAERAERGGTVETGQRGKGRKGKKGRKGRRGKRFDRADKNGDGALTADEVKPEVWEKISKADADGNGAVTKEELKAYKQAQRGG